MASTSGVHMQTHTGSCAYFSIATFSSREKSRKNTKPLISLRKRTMSLGSLQRGMHERETAHGRQRHVLSILRRHFARRHGQRFASAFANAHLRDHTHFRDHVRFRDHAGISSTTSGVSRLSVSPQSRRRSSRGKRSRRDRMKCHSRTWRSRPTGKMDPSPVASPARGTDPSPVASPAGGTYPSPVASPLEMSLFHQTLWRCDIWCLNFQCIRDLCESL